MQYYWSDAFSGCTHARWIVTTLWRRDYEIGHSRHLILYCICCTIQIRLSYIKPNPFENLQGGVNHQIYQKLDTGGIELLINQVQVSQWFSLFPFTTRQSRFPSWSVRTSTDLVWLPDGVPRFRPQEVGVMSCFTLFSLWLLHCLFVVIARQGTSRGWSHEFYIYSLQFSIL